MPLNKYLKIKNDNSINAKEVYWVTAFMKLILLRLTAVAMVSVVIGCDSSNTESKSPNNESKRSNFASYKYVLECKGIAPNNIELIMAGNDTEAVLMPIKKTIFNRFNLVVTENGETNYHYRASKFYGNSESGSLYGEGDKFSLNKQNLKLSHFYELIFSGADNIKMQTNYECIKSQNPKEIFENVNNEFQKKIEIENEVKAAKKAKNQI